MSDFEIVSPDRKRWHYDKMFGTWESWGKGEISEVKHREDVVVKGNAGGVCAKDACGVCLGENCLLGCENRGEEKIVDIVTAPMRVVEKSMDWESLEKEIIEGNREVVSMVEDVKKEIGKMQSEDSRLNTARQAEIEAMSRSAGKSAEQKSVKVKPSMKYEDVSVARAGNLVMRLPTFTETEMVAMKTESDLKFLVGQIGGDKSSGRWMKERK